jgi:hypothetical protein
MPDIFTPMDEFLRAAPHNVLASILGGGQTAPTMSAQPSTTTGNGGTATAAPSGQISVAGPSPRVGLGAERAGRLGEAQPTFATETTIKVVDKESKLPIPLAAVSTADGYDIGITDARGQVKSTDVPSGQQTIVVDAEGYESVEKPLYISPPSRFQQKASATIEMSFLELAAEAGEGVVPGAGAEQPPSQPPSQPPAGYEGGGYYGGGGGYGGGAPTYTPPTYEAPSYGGPSYQAPPAAAAPSYPALPALPGLPTLPGPPDLGYLQGLLLLPLTTIQTVMAVPPALPVAGGGQVGIYGKTRREILGYCPAGRSVPGYVMARGGCRRK